MVGRVVYNNPDLVGRNVGEDELPLRQSVSSHSAARNIGPRRASPVLHIEARVAITGGRCRVGNHTATIEVVLQSVNINLANSLVGIEVDLDVIRVDTARGVVPAAAA